MKQLSTRGSWTRRLTHHITDSHLIGNIYVTDSPPNACRLFRGFHKSWRHGTEKRSALLGHLWGNPPIDGPPSQREGNVQPTCLLWCCPQQAVERTIELSVILDAKEVMRRNGTSTNTIEYRVQQGTPYEIDISTSLAIVYSTVYSGAKLNWENIKAPRHWPLCGEFTGDRWISRTKDQ